MGGYKMVKMTKCSCHVRTGIKKTLQSHRLSHRIAKRNLKKTISSQRKIAGRKFW